MLPSPTQFSPHSGSELTGCGVGKNGIGVVAVGEIRFAGMIFPTNGVPVSGSTIWIGASGAPVAEVRLRSALRFPSRKASEGVLVVPMLPGWRLRLSSRSNMKKVLSLPLYSFGIIIGPL